MVKKISGTISPLSHIFTYQTSRKTYRIFLLWLFCKWHKISLMTTRAGFAGIFTGLLSTLIIFPLFIAQPDPFLQKVSEGATGFQWIAALVLAFLMMTGGFWAGRLSGPAQTWRRMALGGLTGGLAGAIIFCLWGAATAGSARWILPINITSVPQDKVIDAIILQMMGLFLALCLGGGAIGALGGWLSRHYQNDQEEIFDKIEPQMAMNAAITAVPASIVATALAAYIFSRFSNLLADQTGLAILDGSVVTLPLAVSLLLVLASHLVLTLVIPHEAQQAEHRCGLEEVKMAAYVGIGAAPLLALFISLAYPEALINPLVLVALLVSSSMSLKSLQNLKTVVLPRRASFPAPQEESRKIQAKLFGTIATSRGSRLVVLCIGCGLVMVLPLHVSVFSVLINLNHVLANAPLSQPLTEISWGLFRTQALVSMGVITASIILLVVIYLFYLNLGRWFSKKNSCCE